MNSIDSMNNTKPRSHQQSGTRRPHQRASSQDLQASLDRALTQADRKSQALPSAEKQAAVEAASAPMSWALPAKAR